jgi:hypothetical protein
MNVNTTNRVIAFTVVIFSIFSFSCKDKKTIIEVKGTPIDSTSYFLNAQAESYIRNNSFYTGEIQSDSTFVCLYVLPENKHVFFFSDTLNQMYACKYRLIQNRVDTLATVLLEENEQGYFSIDTLSFKQVPIQDVPFLYFSYKEGHQDAAIQEQTVCFRLINLRDLSDYLLTCTGKPSFKCDDCIDGELEADAKLRKNPLILNKLKELSKSSTLIYQRSEKDNDIYYYLNYESKWNQDNQTDNAWGAGYSTITTPIKSTYYTTNLFRLNRGTVNDSIENDKYILVNYFRGNIIGYDKLRKLYFPLWIESCINFCDKNIRFFSEDSLSISYTENGNIEYLISTNDILFDSKFGD